MLKMAVFAPIPSARVSSAMAVYPGARRKVRSAYRRSCARPIMSVLLASVRASRTATRWHSFSMARRSPKACRAASRAASGDIPASISSRVRISR
jgi:hypothetical protein